MTGFFLSRGLSLIEIHSAKKSASVQGDFDYSFSALKINKFESRSLGAEKIEKNYLLSRGALAVFLLSMNSILLKTVFLTLSTFAFARNSIFPNSNFSIRDTISSGTAKFFGVPPPDDRQSPFIGAVVDPKWNSRRLRYICKRYGNPKEDAVAKELRPQRELLIKQFKEDLL